MELLPVEMKVEFLIRLKYRDRMTCRRVCLQWKKIIDDVVGVPIRVTQGNMVFLFNSNKFDRAPIVSIKPGPAVCQWDFCPFSPIFLKSVYLQTKILAENWNLMLKDCRALEQLVFSLSGGKDNHRRQSEKDPEVGNLEPLTHSKLKRIMILNISRSDDKKISALLDNLTFPNLKQCYFSVSYAMIVTLAFGYSKLQSAITSLVTRSEKCHIVNLYSIKLALKNFLEEKMEGDYKQLYVEDFLVDNWKKLAAHYNYQFHSLNAYIYGYTFETLVYEIMENSDISLTDLSLDIKFLMNLNCAHLNRFSKLTRLVLGGSTKEIIILNLIMLPPTITQLFLNVPLSKENIDDIFQLPQLLQLGFGQDFTLPIFSTSHCDAAKTHPCLQTIIMTYKNFKMWNKLKSCSDNEHCWSELKSIDIVPTRRAVVFNTRMTDQAWKEVLQNFSN